MSAGIAAWIAHLVFWGLVLYGLASGEVNRKLLGIALLAWFGGLVAFPYSPYAPARTMFPSFVAMLDIVLVLAIVKRDIRLT